MGHTTQDTKLVFVPVTCLVTGAGCDVVISRVVTNKTLDSEDDVNIGSVTEAGLLRFTFSRCTAPVLRTKEPRKITRPCATDYLQLPLK